MSLPPMARLHRSTSGAVLNGLRVPSVTIGINPIVTLEKQPLSMIGNMV